MHAFPVKRSFFESFSSRSPRFREVITEWHCDKYLRLSCSHVHCVFTTTADVKPVVRVVRRSDRLSLVALAPVRWHKSWHRIGTRGCSID